MKKILYLSFTFLVAGCASLNQKDYRKPASEACEFYLSKITANFAQASPGEFGYQARSASMCEGDFEANLIPKKGGEILNFEMGQLPLSPSDSILKLIVPDSTLPSGSISLHIRTLPTVSLNYRLDSTFKESEMNIGTRTLKALEIQPHELGLYAWTQSQTADRLVYLPVRYANQRSNTAVLSISFVSQKEVKFRLNSKNGQTTEWKSLNLENTQDYRSARKIAIPLDPQSPQEIVLELAVDGKKISDFWLYIPRST